MANSVALIPVRAADALNENGKLQMVGDISLLERTIGTALAAKQVGRVVVSTDDEAVAKHAIKFGAEAPFIRPSELSGPDVQLPQVLNYSLNQLEAESSSEPIDTVVLMEISHPFRSAELIDQMLLTLVDENLDSVFTVLEVRSNLWSYDAEGNLHRVNEDDVYQTRAKKNPLFKEMLGLVTVTKRQYVTDDSFLGKNIAVAPVHYLESQIDWRDPAGKLIANQIILANEK